MNFCDPASTGNGSDLRFNGPALRTRINRPLYGRLFFTVASVKMLSSFYDEGEKVPRCPPVVRSAQSISLAGAPDCRAQQCWTMFIEVAPEYQKLCSLLVS